MFIFLLCDLSRFLNGLAAQDIHGEVWLTALYSRQESARIRARTTVLNLHEAAVFPSAAIKVSTYFDAFVCLGEGIRHASVSLRGPMLDFQRLPAENSRKSRSARAETLRLQATVATARLLGLGAVLLLFCFALAVCANASERGRVPTAIGIETLLRGDLSKSPAYIPALYRNAKLEKIKLLALERRNDGRWLARVALRYDFGERPPTLAAFARTHEGRFDLLVGHIDEGLVLLRFTPVAEIRLLPAKL